jgi:acetyl-CoA carboxylase biotin carboxyl carrier protein
VRFGGRGPPPPPDPDLIRALARLLAETGLGEIEYAVGRHRLRVARAAAAVGAPPAVAAVPGIAFETTLGAAPEAMIANHPGALTAPMVGTIYLAPDPGAAPFVRVGDTVVTGQTLLIIEAMKVMNEIRSTRPGRVVRILVTDAQPVEYGAVLMLIE